MCFEKININNLNKDNAIENNIPLSEDQIVDIYNLSVFQLILEFKLFYTTVQTFIMGGFDQKEPVLDFRCPDRPKIIPNWF